MIKNKLLIVSVNLFSNNAKQPKNLEILLFVILRILVFVNVVLC